jgi:hypothetical protein
MIELNAGFVVSTAIPASSHRARMVPWMRAYANAESIRAYWPGLASSLAFFRVKSSFSIAMGFRRARAMPTTCFTASPMMAARRFLVSP